MIDKKFRDTVIVVTVIGLLILLGNGLFIVRDYEQAVVLRFGKLVRPSVDPGLHIKVPFADTARIFDGRVLTTLVDDRTYLTEEKKRLVVDSFSKWRIRDVQQYYEATGGLLTRAERLISQRVDSGLRNQFADRTLRDVISSEREQLMQDLLADVSGVLERELGVEMVDIRVKAIELPPNVTDSVFQRMRAERVRLAEQARAEGTEISEEIRARAERGRAELLADAFEAAERIRGAADAEAADVYANAYGRDPEFYKFHRTLKLYEASFVEWRDVLVLDGDMPHLRYLLSDPNEDDR